MKQVAVDQSGRAQGRCHVCGSAGLSIIPGFDKLPRVSSDCKPWPCGGQLALCPICLCLQKMTDECWWAEAQQIYDGYSLYYQSNGVEQAVYDSTSGAASLRSERLLRCLQEHVSLPSTGRMLDIGCGNGATLRAFSTGFPQWTLVGAEVNENSRDVVRMIPRVESFHVGPLETLRGEFRLVTLIHVLEHIEGPERFLRLLSDKLGQEGLLVVQVPDHTQNPFDLLVADHASHFTVSTLRNLLLSSGYEVQIVATDWVPKELTAVAKSRGVETGKAGPTLAPSDTGQEQELARRTEAFTIQAVQWLQGTMAAARVSARESEFGLFGTSIAAMAVFGEVGHQVRFFVDEDPHRVGRSVLGRPVYHPTAVPGGSHVFIALPYPLAASVYERNRRADVRFHLPPRLGDRYATT